MNKIIIRNTKCKIIGSVEEGLRRDLDLALSYEVLGHQFMKYKGGWDGRYRLFNRNQTFPIGLLPMVEKMFKFKGLKYSTVDERRELNYKDMALLDPSSGYEMRDYQEEAVAKAIKVGGGVVRVSTGGGKTLIISTLTAKLGVKTVIYVIGIELLYQMKNTLNRAFPHLKVGMVGDGHCDIQDVTICTIWSAASAFNQKAVITDSDLTNDSARKNKKLDKSAVKDMVRQAEMFILDECQYAGSKTVQLLSKESLSARHRYLFSGTPWRENGDDILIESVGGPKFFDINATRLIRDGWLVPPEIHFMDIPIMRGVGKNYQQVYNNYVVNNKVRNEKIISAAKKLAHTGKKTLILVTKIEHGKKLLNLLNPELKVSSLDGNNNTAARLGAIDDIKSGKLDVLIASKIFDQGIDIPELDALILAGSGKSSARALQRVGRVIRMREGKTRAIVVDCWDHCKYLREHSEARYRIYSTEPAFKIKMPKR